MSTAIEARPKPKWFCVDTIDFEVTFHQTEEEAQAKAQEVLDFYRDYADDGWPENIEEGIFYGEIKGISEVISKQSRDELDDEEDWPYDFDELWEVDIVPT